MKLRRIFAAIAACAVAATMAISASAADNFKGSVEITDPSWWTSQEFGGEKAGTDGVKTLEDLIGDTPTDQIDYIIFTSDIEFCVGYNGTGTYSNKDNPSYYQSNTDAPAEMVSELKASDINFEDFYLQICISKGDSVPYTINWEVVTKSAGGTDSTDSSTTDSTTETPENSETPETPENSETSETPENSETPDSSETPSAPSGETTNPGTGAAAGLALATLALAGAAVVAAKKSK